MARRNQQVEEQEIQDDEVEEPETELEEQGNEPEAAPTEPEPSESELVANQSTNVDVAALAPDEILALLEKRRQEITQINKVAKERGIKVPTKNKPKVDDKDRLDEFWEGLGYAVGMRRWAQQRAEANWERIRGVLGILGESFGVEEQAQAIELLGAGYIKAGKQTSFKSEVMKDKATREGAKPEDVLQEFWDSFDLSELEGVRESIKEAM